MQNDREMLELAAKAAGIDVHRGDGWQSDMLFRSIPRQNSPLVTYAEWNPLTDDGDALRLEIQLKLIVAWEPTRNGWNIGALFDGELRWLAFNEDRKRASVAAAAEIGRSME